VYEDDGLAEGLQQAADGAELALQLDEVTVAGKDVWDCSVAKAAEQERNDRIAPLLRDVRDHQCPIGEEDGERCRCDCEECS